MSNSGVPQDLPIDVFKQEMSLRGFEWLKEIGHVHVHIFEHTRTKRVMPVFVERGIVPARYVANAFKIADELGGKP
jgi:hypothetical protein